MEKLKKIWPYLVSMGGALVMLLAFFIPSIQDQWDRYLARKVILQYETLGDDFFLEEKYEMAEEAFAKAFELSEQKRLDIEIKRLRANINRIGSDPLWNGKLPDSLREIDFEYLLHIDRKKESKKHLMNTLNCYGLFLSGRGRLKEAEKNFLEAIRLDSTETVARVNLGTLLFQQEKYEMAKTNYLKAIAIDSVNYRAHYNLGLVLYAQGDLIGAKKQFGIVMRLDPEDTDAKHDFETVNTALKKIED